MDLLCRKCRARSASTYVQSDLALHNPLLYRLFLLTKPYQRQFDQFNPLPDDKISDWSKSKAFADDKLNVTQNIKVVFHRIENNIGKKEDAGYKHFLLFPQCF